MNIEQTPLEGSKVNLHIEVSPQEYEDAVKKGVQLYMLTREADGAEDASPDDVLQAAAGTSESAVKMRMDLATNYLIPRALQQAGIIPVATPQFDTPEDPGEGEALVIDAVVMPKPMFELSDYSDVTIEVGAPYVTEDEVEQQLRYLAEQNGLLTPGASTPTSDVVTDEWVAANIPDDNCNTVEQLREGLRQAGNLYKSNTFEETKTNAATSEMAKRLVGTIPADIIESMRDEMMEELAARMEAEGMTMESMAASRGLTEEALRLDAEREAEVILREGFALDAVFRQAGLDIDDADMQAAFHAIAPGQEDEAEQQLRASGYLFTVEETAQRIKAGKYILDHATVNVRA